MRPAPRAFVCALLLVALVAGGSAEETSFERIIAPGEAPQKLADGFTFTEGPTWMKGKLYFSDMWFRNARAATSPAAPNAAA
jgi:hypothetical protein